MKDAKDQRDAFPIFLHANDFHNTLVKLDKDVRDYLVRAVTRHGERTR
jgi:hypothetical protein